MVSRFDLIMWILVDKGPLTKPYLGGYLLVDD